MLLFAKSNTRNSLKCQYFYSFTFSHENMRNYGSNTVIHDFFTFRQVYKRESCLDCVCLYVLLWKYLLISFTHCMFYVWLWIWFLILQTYLCVCVFRPIMSKMQTLQNVNINMCSRNKLHFCGSSTVYYF